MSTDRLLRYSMCGVMFTLAFIFFFYLFGLSFTPPSWMKDVNSDNLSALVLVVLTTPVLGLMVSTIIFSFSFKSMVRIIYYVPKSKMIIEEIKKLGKDGLNDLKSNSDEWNDDEVLRVYPYYQMLVRQHIDGEAMQFMERRWASYWMHYNCIGAIVLAFFLNAGIGLFEYYGCNAAWNFTFYKFVGVVIFVVYMAFAHTVMRHSWSVASEFEEMEVERKIKSDRQPAKLSIHLSRLRRR